MISHSTNAIKTTGFKWLFKEKKVKPKKYCSMCLERGFKREIMRGKYCLDCKVKVWTKHDSEMSAKKYRERV